jgi:hypothetical protein
MQDNCASQELAIVKEKTFVSLNRQIGQYLNFCEGTIHYMRIVQYLHTIQYQRVVHWEVNYEFQHSACILCIRLALHNHYGTIIS